MASTAASVVAERKPSTRSVLLRDLLGWAFIGPVVLGTLVFNVAPMVPTFLWSFTIFNGLSDPQFIGLQNYVEALGGQDATFVVALKNTLIYTLGAVPFGMLMGLLLALLVNEKIKGITFIRALFFLPVITSQVAIGIVWKWILNSNYGLLNGLLLLVGVGNGPRWLGDPNMAMVSVITVAVWAVMGYNMVLFLAGLQGVPPSLEEAAQIDGAGTWRRFFQIKLPLLTPTVFFVSIMSIISSFQVFNLIFVMTGGGPGSATYVYVYHLYQQAFLIRKYGYGCALAWLLFLVISAITYFQWKMGDRWVFYG